MASDRLLPNLMDKQIIRFLFYLFQVICICNLSLCFTPDTNVTLFMQTVFATDLHSRAFLRLPKSVGVDFRAS